MRVTIENREVFAAKIVVIHTDANKTM